MHSLWLVVFGYHFCTVMASSHADFDFRGFIVSPHRACTPDPNLTSLVSVCAVFRSYFGKFGLSALILCIFVTDRSVEQILVFDIQTNDLPR